MREEFSKIELSESFLLLINILFSIFARVNKLKHMSYLPQQAKLFRQKFVIFLFAEYVVVGVSNVYEPNRL